MPPKPSPVFWRETCASSMLKQSQVSPAGLPVPAHAKVLYKLVAVLSTPGTATSAKSLYHPDAEYELHTSYRQIDVVEASGGLLGFTSQTDAVLKENRSVLASNRLPVAIAVVKAWNLNPRTIPRKHGAKLQYDYFAITGLRSVPASHQDLIDEAAAGVPHSRSPGKAPPAQPAPQDEPGMTFAQHETRNLHASVDALQADLRRRVGLGMVATAAHAPNVRQSLLNLPGAGAADVPPPTAVPLFMLVEVTPRGQVRSLHRDDAVYDIGPTYKQPEVSCEEGGLVGFTTMDDAVTGEPAVLVGRSRLPLAVAELRAWNGPAHGPVAEPQQGQRLALEFAAVERLHEVNPELSADLPTHVALWRTRR